MEELKLILDAVASATPHAKEMFIWWIIVDKLLPMITALAIIFMIGKFAIVLAQAPKRLENLRDRMGVGSSGALIDSEYRLMENWVDSRRTK